VKIASRYADSGLGLAVASLVVLAERLNTIDIATLDERHYRAVTSRISRLGSRPVARQRQLQLRERTLCLSAKCCARA
jgi:hypothetical protein